MDKNDFIKKISEETDVSRPDVRKVIESMEELILEIIATEDKIDFSFGTIEGFTKPPWRVTGMYRSLEHYQKNGHWSDAKVGYPKCTFSKIATDWLAMDPKQYFEQPEHKYTTKARQFRQDNGIEEISEYQGLSEEEIDKLCFKADKIEKGIDKNQRESGRFYRARKERARAKQGKFLLMQQEDLQKQREAGVPEEELVYKNYDQLLEEYYAYEKQRQEAYLIKSPGTKRYREKLSRSRQYV